MSITKEQNTILTILRDFVNGEKTNIDEADAVDWERVRSLAQGQQLAAIVYAQTKRTSFERAYLFQISRSVRIDEQLQQFAQLMDGCEYFLMKGACLKNCYPIPQLRSMGDVDVVIHPEDRDTVHGRMLAAGFVLQKSWEEQWIYEKDDVLYEIHDRLVVSREGNASHDDFAARVWEYVRDNELDWSYHFIYVLTHLRKHLLGHGVGLRQFMDIAVMCRYRQGLDWHWIMQELEQMGMLTFARQVMAFNERTFGVQMPQELLSADVQPMMGDDFYYAALDRIFSDGVFGHGSADEDSAAIAKIMHTQGKDRADARRLMLLRKAFPGYEQLRHHYYLHYLDGHKFLLPVAWVHRAFYRLGSRQCREDMLEMVRNGNAAIDKQDERLSGWGL